MDLHNANKFYESAGKKDKKAPWQWMQLKTTKDLVKALGHGEVKGEDDEYYFDDKLLFHYQLYLFPESTHKFTSNDNHWCEDVKRELEAKLGDGLFRMIFQKAVYRCTNISPGDFSRKWGIHDLWDSLSHEVKDVLAGFFAVLLTQLKAYNRPIDTHYLDMIFHTFAEALSPNLVLSRTKTIAQTAKGKVIINRKNFPSWSAVHE